MQLESKLMASDLSIYLFMIKSAHCIVSGSQKSGPKTLSVSRQIFSLQNNFR